MSLRSVITAVEEIMVAAGCARAAENFTLDRVPASTSHCSYTLGRLEIRPRYFSGGVADYLGARLPILVAFRVHGPHNSPGTFSEAYLQALDTYEKLEKALVANQLSEHGENNSIDHSILQPLLGAGSQEYLLLSITLTIDVLRDMTT